MTDSGSKLYISTPRIGVKESENKTAKKGENRGAVVSLDLRSIINGSGKIVRLPEAERMSRCEVGVRE